MRSAFKILGSLTIWKSKILTCILPCTSGLWPPVAEGFLAKNEICPMLAEFGGNSGKQSAFYRIANITIQNSANRRFSFKWNTIISNTGLLTKQDTVKTTWNPQNMMIKRLNKVKVLNNVFLWLIQLMIWQKKFMVTIYIPYRSLCGYRNEGLGVFISK